MEKKTGGMKAYKEALKLNDTQYEAFKKLVKSHREQIKASGDVEKKKSLRETMHQAIEKQFGADALKKFKHVNQQRAAAKKASGK